MNRRLSDRLWWCALLPLVLVARAETWLAAPRDDRGEISEKAVLIGIFVPLGLLIGGLVVAWATGKVRQALQ